MRLPQSENVEFRANETTVILNFTYVLVRGQELANKLNLVLKEPNALLPAPLNRGSRGKERISLPKLLMAPFTPLNPSGDSNHDPNLYSDRKLECPASPMAPDVLGIPQNWLIAALIWWQPSSS